MKKRQKSDSAPSKSRDVPLWELLAFFVLAPSSSLSGGALRFVSGVPLRFWADALIRVPGCLVVCGLLLSNVLPRWKNVAMSYFLGLLFWVLMLPMWNSHRQY